MKWRESLMVLALLSPMGVWADVPPPPPMPPEPPQCHEVSYTCEFDLDSGTWTIHHDDPAGPKVVIPVPKPKTHKAPHSILLWDGVLAAMILMMLVWQTRLSGLSKQDAV